ncbi:MULTISPECIES: hypothetical protein [Rhodomicrobium]|uniref:hypothetical protein n=1 Tax=Rhodomicrobium TaxID=1068 RepID=UPI000B4A6627|nr:MULTISPECIES: hypothetical protein [Rhodomicrobium]
MFDSVTIIIIFALFVALGGLAFWISQQGAGFGEIKFFQPKIRRLGVIETSAVDGRRRLMLIRRDNVEHLIMIGGPVDMVIETGIPVTVRVPNGLSTDGMASHRPFGPPADEAPIIMQREQPN